MERNVQAVRRLYQAFISRDEATLAQMAGENLVFHVPGRSRFAGAHRGRERILALFEETGRASDNSLHIEIHDVLGTPDHVVGLHRLTGRRGDRVLDQDSCVIVHAKEGVLQEIWLAFTDQYAFDEFWA